MESVLVGISGGVDSSVAALLFVRQGLRTAGCFNLFYETERSRAEMESARKVCSHLGIPFLVADVREDFRKEVIQQFMDAYMHGRTPNPCCVCNPLVKWKGLMNVMQAEGCERVATGHYALSGYDAGRHYVQRADNVRKDQSYALYGLSQEEIACTLFPLGRLPKEEVRKMAEEAGLLTAEKSDSQDICFIPDGDYVGFIRKHLHLLDDAQREEAERICWDRPGNYADENGRVLGSHQGIANYTVGQRKGLGIALGKRTFVKEIRPLENLVVLADNEALFTDRVYIEKVNFQAAQPFSDESSSIGGISRIRYSDAGAPAILKKAPEAGAFCLEFSKPVRAAAPGQAAVLYDGDGRILAGGIIRHGV